MGRTLPRGNGTEELDENGEVMEKDVPVAIGPLYSRPSLYRCNRCPAWRHRRPGS